MMLTRAVCGFPRRWKRILLPRLDSWSSGLPQTIWAEGPLLGTGEGMRSRSKQSRLMSSSPSAGESSILHQSWNPSPVTVLTADEESVRTLSKQWSNEVLRPVVREMDEAGRVREDVLQGLFRMGLMGMEIPEVYGGSGMNFTSACLAVEEISRVDPSVAIIVDIQNTLGVNALRKWGSIDLQQKWLPRLASDTVSAFALSEAESGSDAFALRTRARVSPDGSYYTINGSKLWISNACEAGVFLVFANVDPDKGYRGITAFVVDAHSEGISVGPPEKKLGLRASSTCPVAFQDVVVQASDVLGSVGLGYKYCIEILNEGRVGIAAQQVGLAKGCLYDITLPYIAQRQQFGTAIVDFQAVQMQYAQLATDLRAAELLVYNACRVKEMLDSEMTESETAAPRLPTKSDLIRDASMAKLFASQVSGRVTSQCIDLLGGVGFTADSDMLAEKFYRDCKVGTIYEGTSNIQLQTIAKLIKAEYV